ncbi:2-amino-4-deoxychorismate synthase [Streptomyces sp. WAC 04229]|uniref:anthranilate synthase component I family protein n=1 Tax=Streptomyces sp. WAC 04229 TaxID=2203206 RepID=UPI000F744175|nr:anthranilate synthase component I family protein [Streptomyces sp. WAC 04229]RSN43859.1 2-amino-4-deoxychorismate synthase [Streptomyces sp. WAC 04229]
MARSAPVHVRVTEEHLPAHDPIDLYEELLRTRPADDVFVLENASGAEQAPDRAFLGCGRLLEVRVLADPEAAAVIRITGEPVLVATLLHLADGLGLTRRAAPEPTGAGGSAAAVRAAHPDLLWTFLDAVGRDAFEVDGDLPVNEFAFGFLTCLAYESSWHMDQLQPRTKAPRGPDITLALFRHTVCYDRETGRIRELRAESDAFGTGADPGLARLASRTAGRKAVPAPPAPEPRSVRDTLDRETFLRWAERCLEHIRIGDIYQIQIGHRLDVRSDLTPVDVYRRLRARNPSPYMYLAPRGDSLLIGASPELFFRIEDDRITMRPIAGTARRGADEEDNRLRIKEMRESVKEQAEHVMLVDLCRNDIGRVCVPGTLPVDRLMAVEAYSHVFHLVSSVSGRLAEGVTVWDAVRATFPAGTMTGAPKLRAMEIVDGLEREARGAYAGALGLWDVRGWSELALCIRTVEYDGATYSTQSSAGLVAQSEPESEWRETLAKMGAAHWALTGKELLP